MTLGGLNMVETYVKNIEKVFLKANIKEINDGLVWYGLAREFCEDTGYKYNLPVWKVALMVAALSPRNKWKRNLKDTIDVINNGIDATCATFNTNKVKACKIFHAPTIKEGLEILGNGQKTRAFFFNIYNNNSSRVCVDSWACRIAQYGKDSPTKKGYRDLEKAYKIVAEKHGHVPMDVQAICWVTYRDRLSKEVA